MIDIEQVLRDDADRWQRAVDAGAQPTIERSPGRGPLLLVAGGVAVVAALVVGLLVVVVRLGSNGPAPAGGTDTTSPRDVRALERFTWSDPRSPGTVTFGTTTVNVGDGCSSGVRALRVDGHSMTIGGPVGQQSTCSGTTGAPMPGVIAFDAVLERAGRLHWSINGRTLRLVGRHGRSVTLTGRSPALSVTGQRWVLTEVQGPDGDLRGSFGGALFFVRDRRLHAFDLCNEITADANITPTTVLFSHVTTTATRCGMPLHSASVRRHATAVIDSVLRGTRTYSFRNGQLYIYGPAGDLLLYSRSS